jgi:hypothetical protein
MCMFKGYLESTLLRVRRSSRGGGRFGHERHRRGF